MSSSFLITHVHIIDEQGTVLRNKTVYLENGKIKTITSDISGISDSIKNNAEEISGAGCILTPGLVNLHTHSPMTIFRGIAEDVDADTWFNRDIWPYESVLTPEDIRAGAQLAVAEMINCGVTAYADHYFSADIICETAAEAGLRLDIASTLFGLSGSFDEQLQQTRRLFKTWNGYDNRIAVRLGPHSPYTCTPDQLKAAAELAGELETGIHLHVSETREQVEKSLELYGKTPYQVIADAGLFDLPLIIGHGIHLTQEDRALLNLDKTMMAVCPKTYLKLGTGLGNIFTEPEELPLAVGTDGAASSNTLNPLEQARLLALLGKNQAQTGEAWDAVTVWKILMNGHKALPFDTGKIAEGAPADLVLWSLSDIITTPLYNPLAALLYSVDPSHVQYVWVAGELLKRDGKVLLDTESIISEASERAESLVKRGRGNTELVF